MKGNAKSKDLLSVQISVESLAKRLDLLEDKLQISEDKVLCLDQKVILNFKFSFKMCKIISQMRLNIAFLIGIVEIILCFANIFIQF